MHESERIKFIEERDGEAAALAFAERVAASYVKAALMKSPYNESVEYLVKYIEQKTGVQLDLIAPRRGP